jgi:hypothetical protein
MIKLATYKKKLMIFQYIERDIFKNFPYNLIVCEERTRRGVETKHGQSSTPLLFFVFFRACLTGVAKDC